MRHVEQCTSCYEIVRRKETHVTRKRKMEEKGAPLYLRQGRARLLTVRSRPGREDGEGWVEDSTGVVGCGWNEEEESG